MEQSLEPRALSWVWKGLLSEGDTIHLPLGGQDPGSVPRDDGIANRKAVVQPVDDRVGRQRGTSTPGKRRQHLGFSRGDATGDPDQEGPGAQRIPRSGVRVGLGFGRLGGLVGGLRLVLDHVARDGRSQLGGHARRQ